MRTAHSLFVLLAVAALTPAASAATTLYFNDTPTNAIGFATFPPSPSNENEAADDFLLASPAIVNSATFTGLLVPAVGNVPAVQSVDVEIYRVFPNDSNTSRTITVPTRTNSPSDVAFDERDSPANMTFSSSTLNTSFTALNSVLNGIHPSPNQTTGGEGPVTGAEVQFTVPFSSPVNLPADHYFFVPQVAVTGVTLYWLSASRPIAGAGTTPFTPDLQAWIRNSALDPDWLRVGTDIVGGATPPTYNAAFSLSGTATPEPASLSLLAAAFPLLLKRRP